MEMALFHNTEELQSCRTCPAQGQSLGRSRASSALSPCTRHPWAVFWLASVLTSEPCLGVNNSKETSPIPHIPDCSWAHSTQGNGFFQLLLAQAGRSSSCGRQLRALLSQEKSLHQSEFSAPQHRHLMNPSELLPCQAGPPGPVWSPS